MKLTAKSVQSAKSAGIPRKLFDGHGLYLHITKTGRKWRYTYRLNGKPKEFTIGDADIVSLAEARKKHQAARLIVLEGEHPVEQRQKARDQKRIQAEQDLAFKITVGSIIDEWFETGCKDWATSHSSKIKSRLDNHIPDWFREKPVADVKPSDIVNVYTKASECSDNLVHRVRSYLRRCFDTAVANELISTNPARHPMADAAVPKNKKYNRLPHIKQYGIIGDVLLKLESHSGNPSISAALRLLPYIFTRPGELRNMQWHEIEFNNRLWRIPAEKMKGRRDHLVPLSDQVLEILENHYKTPGIRLAQRPDCDYVFPGRDENKPFSNMALSKAMKELGIPSTVIVPHGWRHTASSAINEKLFNVDGEKVRFSPDAVEIQLAHSMAGVRGVYNAAEYIEERRQMLQAWADWLDELKSDARIRIEGKQQMGTC